MPLGLQYLPVELLYQIQLLALSESLPLTSRHLKNVFDASPNSFRAQYIMRRIVFDSSPNSFPEQYITRRIVADPVAWPPDLCSVALRYPLCTPAVLGFISTRCAAATNLPKTIEVPKRLFQRLRRRCRSVDAQPIPFLRLIKANPAIPPLDVNVHDGFALTMAVHASFVPLIRYLLESGANPATKEARAIKVAVWKENLKVVRLLIEPHYGGPKPSPKTRPIPDRIRCNEYPEFLCLAMKVDARDIADYLRDKGCVPDSEVCRWFLSAHQGASSS